MATIDALIFDIDGTLWNASAASAKGWNQGLAKLEINRTVSAEQIEQVAGHPFEQCVDLLFPGLRSHYAALIETLNECEMQIVKSEGGKFYDGVRNGMIQLARTYRILLVSNCQAWYLNLFLEYSGFKSVLAGVDCHGLSGMPKHDMLTRLKRTHALANPVYIGDTAHDEKAAQLANLALIYVSWGFGKPEGQPHRVHSFRELVRHLGVEERCEER